MNSDLAEGNVEGNDGEAATANAEELARKRRLKPVPLPPAGKGILISPGFRDRPVGEEDGSGTAPAPKEVKFADGVKPGDGTSPSAEEISSPLPAEKVQKKKVVKKKRMKKKIKVQVVRTLPLEELDDDDDDDSSPPPPPPGSPPRTAYPVPAYPPPASTPAPVINSGFTFPPPGFAVVPSAPAAMFQQFPPHHQLPPPVVPAAMKK